MSCFADYLSNRKTISPDSSNSPFLIISNRQVIPSSHLNLTAPYCSHSFSRSRGESDEEFSLPWSAHHPDVNSAPGPRLVVKDWSRTLWLYPDCDGYFVRCIKFAIIRERYIAAPATTELNGSRGETIGASVWPHLVEDGSRVLIWRNVPSIENTAERVGSHWRWSS